MVKLSLAPGMDAADQLIPASQLPIQAYRVKRLLLFRKSFVEWHRERKIPGVRRLCCRPQLRLWTASLLGEALPTYAVNPPGAMGVAPLPP